MNAPSLDANGSLVSLRTIVLNSKKASQFFTLYRTIFQQVLPEKPYWSALVLLK